MDNILAHFEITNYQFNVLLVLMSMHSVKDNSSMFKGESYEDSVQLVKAHCPLEMAETVFFDLSETLFQRFFKDHSDIGKQYERMFNPDKMSAHSNAELSFWMGLPTWELGTTITQELIPNEFKPLFQRQLSLTHPQTSSQQFLIKEVSGGKHFHALTVQPEHLDSLARDAQYVSRNRWKCFAWITGVSAGLIKPIKKQSEDLFGIYSTILALDHVSADYFMAYFTCALQLI